MALRRYCEQGRHIQPPTSGVAPRQRPTIRRMRSHRRLMLPALLLVLSRCGGYDPPVHADRTTEHYKSDLEACRKSSSHAVYLRNARSPGPWIISPITGPPMVRAAIRTCMTGKGYALVKNVN